MSLLYVCLAACLLQGIHGFVGFHLKDGEVQQFENEWPHLPELQTFYYQAVSYDDCDFNTTLNEAYKLACNVSEWVYNSSNVLAKDVNQLYNCSEATTVTCFLKTIKQTGDDVLHMLPQLVEYHKELLQLFHKLRQELERCFPRGVMLLSNH